MSCHLWFPLCRITRYKEEEYCIAKFVQQKHSSGLLEKLTTPKSTSVHQLKQIPKSFPGSPGLTHPMIHVQMTYTTAESTTTVDLIGTGICQYLLKDYNPTNVIYADLNVEWCPFHSEPWKPVNRTSTKSSHQNHKKSKDSTHE